MFRNALTKSFAVLSLGDAPATTSAVLLGGVRHASRHGGRNHYRKDFTILKDYPVGPHKTLAPYVKHDGRIGEMKNYRNVIYYPPDGRYTTDKLDVRKLGGRDPDTGRKVIQKVGQGRKQKARWIDWRRWPVGRDPEQDLVERVIDIRYDPMRKPMIALTAYGSNMRWQVATDKMQAGDLITTTVKIPANPVKPVEGNAYPLGALPVGSDICQVQWYPDGDEVKVVNARENVKIVRKVGDRVIIQRPDTKRQYSLDQRCMCVAGTISIHPLKAGPIGTPQRARWMGIAPHSGLWHKKTGIHGRKIKALPPVEEVQEPEEPKDKKLTLHLKTEGVMGMGPGRKRPFDVEKW